MGLFDKIREPIILKDSDSLKKQHVSLEESYALTTGEDREKLEKEINNIKTGIDYETDYSPPYIFIQPLLAF